MSSIDASLTASLAPAFRRDPNNSKEPEAVQEIIDNLDMQEHLEGGYFVETDRDPRKIPNPFIAQDSKHDNNEDKTRSASTTIFYLITPKRPQGGFHRNKARTVHTLHQGRGRYVIIHADEAQGVGKAWAETFVVGHDLAKGEKLQWLVEGGKYKASYLLPDKEGESDSSKGLLISETVVPGFDFADHDFMKPEQLDQLLTPEQRDELSWLLNQQ